MKRVTSNIVNDAKRILRAWKSHTPQDKEYKVREVAGILGVEFETLNKRL